MGKIGAAVAALREALLVNDISVDGLQISLPEQEAERLAYALKGEVAFMLPMAIEMPTDRAGRPVAVTEFMGVWIVPRRD